MEELRARHTECEACGFETSILDHGTGKYAAMMVCGRCESQNFSEQRLRVTISDLETSKQKLKSALSCIVGFYGTNMPLHLLSKVREALEDDDEIH